MMSRMSNKCNPICATCPKAYNTVNGRRCNELNKNVEYAKEPICENEIRKSVSQKMSEI